jgi:sulfur-carrier protein adenylyltransferase/sulfurtransferase
MPVLKIPTPLRFYTDGLTEVPLKGRTVAEAMHSLLTSYPAIETHLYNSQGDLRPFVNLFVGEVNIRDLQGLDTPLEEDDRLLLIPSIAGGSAEHPHPPEALPNLSHEEILRYSRHLLIPQVGLEGQQRLKAASALVIGAGGLGSPVALYLAAAGVGHIGLVDNDVVDASNLQRQVIHGMDRLGQSKVESARARLLDLNPDIQVTVYDQPFSSRNALEIAAGYDVLIDGTDNFPTRYLTNDVCVLLGKPNVYGSIFRFDGQASVFDARQGPCYRCLFPEPPPPGLVPSCAEGGVLGVLPGTIGTIQATEALKLLLGIGSTLAGRLLLYDALSMTFEFVQLKKNPRCKICGLQPEVTALIDYEAFCGVPGHDREEGSAGAEWDISVGDLAGRLASNKLLLVDVREPHELAISALPEALNIPLGQLAARLPELDSAREMVLFCKSGVRSKRALELLVSAGFRKVKNLQGGINAWAREIDPALPVY